MGQETARGGCGKLLATLTAVALGAACTASHNSPAALDAGPASGEPAPVSGTRLRRSFLEPESGERVAYGWYDTLLEVYCRFSTGPDGVFRCRPEGSLHLHRTSLDPACSEPVYPAFGGCSPPPALVTIIRGDQFETFRVGDRLDPMPTVYRCPGGAFSARWPLYTLVSIEAELVQAEVWVPPPGHNRVEREWLIAEDGATQVLGFYDTQVNERCSPVDGIDTGYCLPESIGWARRGGDECAERWAEGDVQPGDLAVAMVESDDLCHAVSEILQVGEEVVGPVFGDACAPTPGEGPYHHLSPAPTDAVAVVERVTRSTGRLELRGWITPAGVTLAEEGWGWFYDRERGSHCAPGRVAGDLRCLPSRSGGGSWSLYADPDCTRPVGSTASACHLPSLRFVGDPEDTSCDPDVRLYEEAEAEPVTAVYSLFAGRCEPFEIHVDTPPLVEWREVPPERFAPLHRIFE